jgi:predicted transcriptional regulator
VRRTFDLDPETDARLNALAAEKGKDAAAVVADAVVFLIRLWTSKAGCRRGPPASARIRADQRGYSGGGR